MSIASHVLLIGNVSHPLAGDDAVTAALALVRDLGGADVVEGGTLIELDEAGEEIGDLTEELAYPQSNSSKSCAY